MSDAQAGAAGQPQGAARSDKVQRLRVRYARGPEAASIGHLDLARVWERAFREAGIDLSYTESNRPQPRLTLAAGLPMGVTSGGELLDVVLRRRVPPGDVAARVAPHLAPGLAVLDAREVGLGLPSLPTAVRWADYEVDVPAGEEADVEGAIASFLAAARLPWEDTRGEKTRRYDLRPLVLELRAAGRCAGATRLVMRLRGDAGGVGRPDQVVKALGLAQPLRIHRLRLVLAEASPAHDAWRRKGRFVE